MELFYSQEGYWTTIEDGKYSILEKDGVSLVLGSIAVEMEFDDVPRFCLRLIIKNQENLDNDQLKKSKEYLEKIGPVLFEGMQAKDSFEVNYQSGIEFMLEDGWIEVKRA